MLGGKTPQTPQHNNPLRGLLCCVVLFYYCWGMLRIPARLISLAKKQMRGEPSVPSNNP